MSKFIGFIAAAFAVLGALSIAMMFYGHANQGGMAVLAFQLWSVIGAMAAIVFGFISKLISGRSDQPTSGAAKFGIGLGILVLLALLVGFIIIG